MIRMTQRFTVWVIIGLVVVGVGGVHAVERSETLIYNVGTEPETLDPALWTGIPEASIFLNCFDGLVRLDAEGRVYPGAAERWEESADGRTYTFHLRKARWSNGDPVRASDFVYAWHRVLRPGTASEYVYQLYYIRGARDYTTGKLDNPSSVGIRAVDDQTLEVQLESPTPYFLSLLAHTTYMPVNPRVVANNPEWALDPKTYVGNGAFQMVEWRHHSRLKCRKNPYYWNAKAVRLHELVYRMIEEESTELTAFETGAIDITHTVPLPDIPRLERTGQLQRSPYIGTYYVCFNTRKAPFDNADVRRAFTLAVNRQVIVEKVTRGGQVPAQAFVPPGLKDADGRRDFRPVGGNYFADNVVKEAQALLAKAGYPGGKGFPKVTYLYNTMEQHKIIAEALQDMWRRALGVKVRLQNQEWKVVIKNRRDGNYQVARHGWIGDYLDPMTFLDLFVTESGNNDAQWSNLRYDALIQKAKQLRDQERRMASMHQAEAILFDDMPICPIYYYVNLYVQKPYVKNVVRNPLGYIDFTQAYIERP